MKYLVTGGAGNIACQFSQRLPRDAEVLLTDIAKAPFSTIGDNATYQRFNVTQRAEIEEMVGRERPDVILHFASLLSGKARQIVIQPGKLTCKARSILSKRP